MLAQCFQSLKTYGKEPEQLEAIIPMFMMVLADYPFDEIEQAFAFYLKTNNEMPAPSDIANIIERGGKPPFSQAVYSSASRKNPEDRTGAEWEYIEDYEKYHITGRN